MPTTRFTLLAMLMTGTALVSATSAYADDKTETVVVTGSRIATTDAISAAPISIWAAAALEVADSHIMRLAGVMYNSAVTTFRLRDDAVTLFSFNGVPHLNEAGLRTFR